MDYRTTTDAASLGWDLAVSKFADGSDPVVAQNEFADLIIAPCEEDPTLAQVFAQTEHLLYMLPGRLSKVTAMELLAGRLLDCEEEFEALGFVTP